MRAEDIATTLVIVDRSTPALDAIRQIAEHDLIGLVVARQDGHPQAVVSSVDLLRAMLPDYLRGDLTLANTLGDSGVDDLRQGLESRTVGDLVDDDAVSLRRVLVVPADAGLVEIAARMAEARTQVALIEDPSRTEPAFVTLPGVFDAMVQQWESDR